MPGHYDVMVIGLGAMGSATLWQLARRNARVLGVDRWQPPHAHGSTHGETRLTRLAIGEGAEYAPLAIRSQQIWREIEHATGMDLFRQNGLLIYGPRDGEASFHGSADFLGTTVQVAEQIFGEARPLLSATEMAARFPQFRVDPDDTGYYEPEAGMLFPERCIEAQLALARGRGADIRYGETVAAIEPRRGGGVRVRTSSGTYDSGRAIVSAGAWVRHFIPASAARWFTITRQVLSWFRPAETPDLYLPARMPNFIRLPTGGEPIVYGFPRISDVVADMKVALEAPGPACDPDRVDRTIGADELLRLHTAASRAVRLQPQMTRAVTCLYTETPGSRFVIDTHPTWTDVIVVSPCSGHGFKHSAAIGECVAQLALRERPSIELSPFRFDCLEDSQR